MTEHLKPLTDGYISMTKHIYHKKLVFCPHFMGFHHICFAKRSDAKTFVKKNMFKLLKKYGIWLVLLSIPLWNIFNMIFVPMGIAEEESVATGTVILFYLGLYIGHKVSVLYFRNVMEISRETIIRSTLAFITALMVLMGLVRQSVHSPSKAAIAFLIISMVMLLAVLIAAMGTAFFLVSENRLKTSESQALMSQSELQLLQSQLSPHFLFNTLNNLYGLSLVKDDKLPGLLLKLSELLRHSVYQGNSVFVPLNEEINYIKNYVEFEKIRLEGRLSLSVNLETSDDLSIAPMLLIVFIENAFKHSKNTSHESIKIDISLKLWEDRILFSVFNTFDASQVVQNALNKNSGLGLENARKRLELLYPGKHELTIEETVNTYKVLLQLKIS